MKLIYITASMPYGPGEAFFIPEINELLKRDVEFLIVPRSPSGEVVNEDAKHLTDVALKRPLLSAGILLGAALETLRHPWRALKATARLFTEDGPVVLLKNLAVLPKGLWLARVARDWKADHIHVQWLTTTSTMAMIASEMTGIPFSCTAHRGDIVDSNMLETKSRRVSFLRFISEDGLEIARKKSKQPLGGNLFVLHLSVDIPRLPTKEATFANPPVLLCAAHLIERKGQRYLIEAVDMLKDRGVDIKLLLAGEGEQRGELEAMVEQSGLRDRISFLGQVGHKDLLEMYERREIDIVVLPTLHEDIPVNLIEDMVYCVHTVSTETGGIPELLKDGAGIILQPRDPLALADAIEEVIGSQSLREKLVAAGRRRVEDGWSTSNFFTTTMEHIKGPAENTGSGE